MPPFPDPAARALLEVSERYRQAVAAIAHGAAASYRDCRALWSAKLPVGMLDPASYAAGMRRALELVAVELDRAGLRGIAGPLEDTARMLGRDAPPVTGLPIRRRPYPVDLGSGGKTP